MQRKTRGDEGTAARLGVVLSFSGRGGVERMVLRLLGGLQVESALPLAIDLVAIRAGHLPNGSLPSGVRLVDLGLAHSTRSAGALASYLRENRPDALLVAKDRAIRSAVRARARAGTDTRLVGRLGTHLSASLEGKSWLRRWLRTAPMPRIYGRVDRVVAISRGVAEDIHRLTGLPEHRIPVIPNPVVAGDLGERARAPVDHPWLQTGQPPVLLGAGRLTRQKDFATLFRACAQLRERRPIRVIVLGEGEDRPGLLAEAARLGISEAVDLPGEVPDPLPWMQRAAVFVLSSRWEGSGNALTEAVALGRPVVSTDCPSGPGELLAEAPGAPLVPVGDESALARAVEQQLDSPPDPDRMAALARKYTVARSARRYLEALALPARAETDA